MRFFPSPFVCAIFVAVGVFSLLLPIVSTQQSSIAAICAFGVWGDWGNWSSCVPNLNIQRRIRPCNGQPAGCVPATAFNCSGSYSDVKPCGDGNSALGDGWNAQMVQSMSINRQYPTNYPPGSSFRAGMVEAMSINDTYG